MTTLLRTWPAWDTRGSFCHGRGRLSSTGSKCIHWPGNDLTSIYLFSGAVTQSGSATFIKSSKVRLLDREGVSYNDEFDRVALITRLEVTGLNRPVMVINTHLCYTSASEDFQLSEIIELERDFIDR